MVGAGPACLRGLDATTVRRIHGALRRYAETERGDVRKLANVEPPTLRLRVGDWRIFLDVDDLAVTVLRVRHRREAYR